ncbi:MAG: acyl carrier protein [Betaproteobacteria bacterium]|nr:acyl carrier protein [Betaproteobacteria bacterium]
MNDADTKSRVLAIIKSIAPELDASTLRPDQSLRRQIDLDSMDWLNVLMAIHEKLHVNIPETDYGKLGTLNDLVAYIEMKLAALP